MKIVAAVTIVMALTSSVIAQDRALGTVLDTGGLLSPGEFRDYTRQFDSVDIPAQALGDPASAYTSGGALFFAKDKPAGLLLLRSSAAAGNADAAVALGIAANNQGDPASAYKWFAGAADAGDQTAILLKGRAELYGLGTPSDSAGGLETLLGLYNNGNTRAAWDLAKASSYDWTNGELPNPQLLWGEALKSGDPATIVDYAKYLRAGGSPAVGYETIEQFTAPVLAGQDVQGAIASWDVFRDAFEQPSPDALQALQDASFRGNLDAAARYGDWLVFNGTPEQQELGLSFLKDAATDGRGTAFTSLGKFYLQSGTNALAARDNLLAGLNLGDTDAGVPLADYYLSTGDFGMAYDSSLLTATSGSSRGKIEASAKVLDICQRPEADCTKVPVAFVTSRQHRMVDGRLEFEGLPNEDFQPTYGFATVLVPGEDAPQDTDFDWFGAIFNAVSSFFGVSPAAPDPLAKSAVTASLADDWDAFSDGLGKAVAEDRSRGGSGELLMFVHGVNTSFDGAILAAARLKLKGNLPGVPVVYSWPAGDLIRTADGSVASFGYTADVTTAGQNCKSFQEFLVRFTRTFGSDKTVLIAHSHGSDMVVSGLTACRAAAVGTERVSPKIRHLIYAAPDIDRQEFIDSAPQLVDVASDITLYASDADLAMFVSGDLLSASPRAGMGGNRRTVVAGVDTIDLSNIASHSGSTDGHGYLWTANAVLDDLNEIIRHDSRPVDRCLEQRPSDDGGAFWQFRASCGLQ